MNTTTTTAEPSILIQLPARCAKHPKCCQQPDHAGPCIQAKRGGNVELPLQLRHGQLIRVKGFRNYNDITVGTITGSTLANNEKYSHKPGDPFHETPEEAIERAVRFGHSLNPWTNQSASVLTADYRGKKERLDAEAAARAAAPELENGQTVEIEGALYTVRVAGEQYSDPVHFLPLK